MMSCYEKGQAHCSISIASQCLKARRTLEHFAEQNATNDTLQNASVCGG